MVSTNQPLSIDRDQLLPVLRDLEYILISLHKIGSHYAADLPEKHQDYCAETTRFIDQAQVTQRLAKIRSVLSGAFDQTRGEDDLTEVERALEGLAFWAPTDPR
ncbi:hypothetical protein [Pseudomonas sp. CGJS7]|uniref:hypothetical protein n=1 Tax=Pseudomonas sp. CGJS7 TaxID=3109348 RepID=UPI0030084898